MIDDRIPAAGPHKATHAQTRSYNGRLVLRTIYDRGLISRAEIARLTTLTRTSVSDVVGELLESGLVEEVGRGPSTGGKAPILLRVVSDARLVVGVEVAETEIRGALVDLRGGVHGRRTIPIESGDGERTLRHVFEMVADLIAEADRPLLGIGIATPGLVDLETGTVRWSVHLEWRDLELRRLLRERFDLPAGVANDSHAAALAEYTFGGYEPGANPVVIKVGRGIGAGIILDGRLFVGDGSGAGEIGHTTVGEGDIECRCGRYGCLETFASSRALLIRAGRMAAAAGDSALTAHVDDPHGITLRVLADALGAGDPLAGRLVADAGRALGAAVANVVGVLDVERVVLVGSLPELGEPWLSAVRDEVEHRAFPLLVQPTVVRVGIIDPDLGILGASALLLASELGLSLVR